MQAEVGTTVELSDVLMLGGEGGVHIGTPRVAGARVLAEVIEHGKDKKILVFKYKNKTRYRRRHGHRQDFTRLAIRQILTEDQEATAAEEKPKRPTRRTAKPKAEERAGETAAPIEGEAAAPETAAAPKPRRRKAVEARQEAVVKVAAEAAAPEAAAAPKPRRRKAAAPEGAVAEVAAKEATDAPAGAEETPEGE